jgi:hypothetical protein
MQHEDSIQTGQDCQNNQNCLIIKQQKKFFITDFLQGEQTAITKVQILNLIFLKPKT